MNMNPWLMERLAEDYRDRIQRDMKQLRLEEKAMQAGCTEEKQLKLAYIFLP